MTGGLDVREMINSLAAFDVGSLSGDEIASTVLELQALRNAVDAACAVAMDQLDRSGRWADDGAASAASWAAARTGTRRAELRAQVRAGKALRLLPSFEHAAREGRLSGAHLGVLGDCVRAHPELASRDEEVLATQALELDADAFRAAGRYWCDLASNLDGPDPASTPDPPSEFSLVRGVGGRWIVQGELDARDGALLDAVLQAGIARPSRAQRDGDPSVGLTMGQLRAQALMEAIAEQLRATPGEASVPDRYRVGLVIRHDDVADLGEEGCDAAFYRIVVNAKGEVLDVGRDTRRWPTGIRRAITYRDGGCVFPGCGRPPSWCDIHHCHHWENGGTTSIDNGALLCRRHHRFIHDNGWSIRVERGRAVTYRDDGTRYVITTWHVA